nr:hypothetical protein [uncultured Draconibacterium sp.]
MKTIISFIFLFLLSSSVFGKEAAFKGDTIWYKFDKVLIEVTSNNAKQYSIDKLSIQERIKQIKGVLSEMTIAPLAEDESIVMTFKNQDEVDWNTHFKEIELERIERNKTKLVVFEDGTTFEKEQGQYKFHFLYQELEIKISINDLNNLEYFSSAEFNEKLKMVTDFFSESERNERKRMVGWLDLRTDEVKTYFSNIANQNYDMIILSGGIGAGWVKNSFVSDINFRVGLSFGKKGMYKNIYAIDYSMMYDFSESNDNDYFKLNHFVSLAWEHNFSSTPEKDKWYGFSVGYLVKRNNDFFKKNTFKVAVNKKINDTFTVKPELYFNDFLKNVYPGIRLSVAF